MNLHDDEGCAGASDWLAYKDGLLISIIFSKEFVARSGIVYFDRTKARLRMRLLCDHVVLPIKRHFFILKYLNDIIRAKVGKVNIDIIII